MGASLSYTILGGAIIGAGLIVVAVTVAARSQSDNRWVRIWDFPRLQIAVVGFCALAAGAFWFDLTEPWPLAWAAAVVGACAWQVYRIWPYTPLHPAQAKATADCSEHGLINMLIANVRMDNPLRRPLFDLVASRQPDLVLLVETDDLWDRELGEIARRFPHCIGHPRDNTYGIHLFSALELVDPQVRFLVEDDIPSIRTGVRLKSGQVVTLYALHPRPPPRADTTMRDAELILIGGEARGDDAAIVAGDLNDVAWSRTTRLFQDISGLLDPRIGRGLFATFNANWRFLRWPLDHVFFGPAFMLHSVAVMPSIGSDHFPLWVSLCYRPGSAERRRRPHPEASDLEDAREILRNAREQL